MNIERSTRNLNETSEGALRVLSDLEATGITELKEVDKERARIAAIIESSNNAIVSKTPDGIVIGWNYGAEHLYGYTAEEMIGHSISVLFPADHCEEYLRLMVKVRAGEAVPPFDTVRQRKDGTQISVSVTLTPIEAQDGKVLGASKHSHDITRIKKLEAQFIEAQKMEVIGQLAGGVAHDFNNILSIITGYSHLITSELSTDSPLQEYVEAIHDASERAAGLTRQLLLFSRKQTVQPVILNLNTVVIGLNQLLRRLIDDNIKMTVELGKQTGCVKADSGYVGQILMNLVVNARDAMPIGGKLTIATRNVTLDGQYVASHPDVIPGDYAIISVSDTGTGMTDHVKAHLFEAFFTTKPKGQGTGLGLATCQTIVQQCGGHIDIQSEIGKGTTFNICFPRVDESRDNATISAAIVRGTETVLIVENEPLVRNLACKILTGQGYNVLSAANGQEALHVAGDHQGAPIRLVVTDVVMPLIGGRRMSEGINSMHADLKTLYTSGYTDGRSEEGGEFLLKPYTPANLVKKVRALLDNGAAKASAN